MCMDMKALIVGAGAQGAVIAGELLKSPDVTEIRLSDIDLKRAEGIAKSLESDKVNTHRVDANKVDDIMRAAKDVNLIVNATTWIAQFNLNIMEAALKVGAHYEDMASFPAGVRYEDNVSYPPGQLSLMDKWKKAGLTALIDCGSSPGVTNVLAAHAADRLDRVEKVRVLLAGKVLKEAKEYVPAWSPETLWGDMARYSVVYEDGEFKRVPPWSGEEVYAFPDPIGPVTVYWHNHEEPETLGRFIGKGVRYADFKMGGPEFSLAKAIFRHGLLDTKPREVKGVKVVPRDFFFALIPPTLPPEEVERKRKAGLLGEATWCMLVEVHGEKAGEKLTYIIYRVAKTGPDEPMIPLTGIAASIFARMLGKGRIKTKGVVPPEALEPEVRQAFLAELAEYGVVFTERAERCLP